MTLRRAGKGYVLGVETDHQFNSWVGKPLVAGTAEVIADSIAPSAWARLSDTSKYPLPCEVMP